MESEQAAEVIREMMDYVLEFSENCLVELRTKADSVVYTGIFANDKSGGQFSWPTSPAEDPGPRGGRRDSNQRHNHHQRRRSRRSDGNGGGESGGAKAKGCQASTFMTSTASEPTDASSPQNMALGSPLIDESRPLHSPSQKPEELFIGDMMMDNDYNSNTPTMALAHRQRHEGKNYGRPAGHVFSSGAPSNLTTPPMSPPVTSSMHSPISSPFSSGTRITLASETSSKCRGSSECSSSSSLTSRKESSSVITPLSSSYPSSN